MPKVFLGSQSVEETTVNVGPIDPSVLWGQSKHRCSDTHANQQISFRCLKVEDNIISEEAKTIVQAVGLWDVAYISHPKLDPKLLTALCERWRPETHTFHLPHGEMTITLEDVAVLLGLRVHGEAVIDNYVDEEDIVGACVELLGLDLPDGRKDFVQIKQLRQNLLEAQLTAEQQARTFILIILGGVLFTTTKKDNVSLIYLPLLRNLQQAAQYSWGSAVLAVTYRGLCEASQLNVATFSGCAILVQLWSWEHLHVGRPVLKGELPAGELHPLGYRWSFLKRSYNHQVRIPNLAYYRDDLESQSSDQVTWMPYSTLWLDITPPVCCDQPELFRVKVPLIHFNVVEWHRPDRVMRQFGLNQHIPEITTDEIQEHVRVHKLTRKGPHLERRWTIRHQDFLTLWVNRADYVQQERKPYTDYNQYITWYHNITRRFITAPRPSTGETLQGHPPSTPFVLHGGEVGTVMNIMAKGVPFARKAAKGGLKFTKNNFKLLADHYLETCRLSYDAVGQLPMYEEHVRRADLDIANEQQIGESEPERRPSELWQGVRVRGALGRGRNGESSSRGVYKPSIKFRAVEFHRKNELSMDKSQPDSN